MSSKLRAVAFFRQVALGIFLSLCMPLHPSVWADQWTQDCKQAIQLNLAGSKVYTNAYLNKIGCGSMMSGSAKPAAKPAAKPGAKPGDKSTSAAGDDSSGAKPDGGFFRTTERAPDEGTTRQLALGNPVKEPTVADFGGSRSFTPLSEDEVRTAAFRAPAGMSLYKDDSGNLYAAKSNLEAGSPGFTAQPIMMNSRGANGTVYQGNQATLDTVAAEAPNGSMATAWERNPYALGSGEPSLGLKTTKFDTSLPDDSAAFGSNFKPDMSLSRGDGSPGLKVSKDAKLGGGSSDASGGAAAPEVEYAGGRAAPGGKPVYEDDKSAAAAASQPAGGAAGNNAAAGRSGQPSETMSRDDLKNNHLSHEDNVAQKRAETGEEHCVKSALINGQYGCDSTYSLVENSKIANQVGQLAGGLAVGVAGQAATMRAANSGSQSGALQAGASTANLAGMKDMALGAGNLAFAFLQYQKQKEHGEYKSTFNKEKGTVTLNQGGSVAVSSSQENAQAIITNNDLNYAKKYQGLNQQIQAGGANAATARTQKETGIKADIRSHYSASAAEQEKAKQIATQGAFMSGIAGAQQMITGMANIASAKQLENAARQLQQAEDASKSSTFVVGSQIPPGDNLGNRPGMSIGNSAGQSGANSAAQGQAQPSPDPGNTLGGPVALGGAPEGLAGPAAPPAKFVPGNPPGGGGGGNGGISAGSTSAANGSTEEPSARLANNGGGSAYEGGGGGFRGAGGAGEKGPDLSGMLAQFLPKKDDEGGNKNGILDFGGRAPASIGDGQGSLLDRTANLFDRIHQTYQDKQKRKKVGI